MLKALLKKQFLELGQFYLQNRKTGKRRSGAGLVGIIILYVFVFLILGFSFGMLSVFLANAMVSAGMDWLYFALMSLAAVFLGVVGSVFNTYAGLYHAKDNDLLLSMPIPPRMILFTRMIGVYAMGLLYEALVLLPAMVVYWAIAPLSVAGVVFPILLLFILGFFVLTLTCALGWVVALIASRLKNKSAVTVILTLVFLGVYYFFYARLSVYLQLLITNMDAVGDTIRRVLYPFYQIGLAACGNALSLLLVTAFVGALFALTYFVLSRSFRRIVTTNRGAKKAVYHEQEVKAATVGAALLRKECKRFLASPTYMLNCGLGVVIMPVFAVFLLVKRDMLTTVIAQIGFPGGAGFGLVSVLAALLLCMFTCMIDISAPSVSLEGKNLWIVQSMPVAPWAALRAKLSLHCLIGLPPMLISAVLICYALSLPILESVLVCAISAVFTVFVAAVGLWSNLLRPNLNWTNETVPVKQGLPVFLCLMGGWVLVILFGVAYFLLMRFISHILYLALLLGFLLAVSAVLLVWLKRSGAARFAAL